MVRLISDDPRFGTTLADADTHAQRAFHDDWLRTHLDGPGVIRRWLRSLLGGDIEADYPWGSIGSYWHAQDQSARIVVSYWLADTRATVI